MLNRLSFTNIKKNLVDLLRKIVLAEFWLNRFQYNVFFEKIRNHEKYLGRKYFDR
ncbi:hypothetical protein UNH65_18130 [Chitinophaga sp. 180180018-2]|nr:hypothetical protein [Chitinophaga sp. 212800010-3]